MDKLITKTLSKQKVCRTKDGHPFETSTFKYATKIKLGSKKYIDKNKNTRAD